MTNPSTILQLEEWGKLPEEPKAEPLDLICFADVKTEAVSWLWHPYIPRGKITLMQGDPGCGKTFLAAEIIGCISRGRTLPGDTSPGDPAFVLFQNGEDGASDTLKPRLDGAGADCRRVFIIDESKKAFSIQNVEGLREVMNTLRPALVVIDPLQLYLGAKVDMHRANEVRPIMTGLARLAEEFNSAILILMHMNKGTGQKAIYRGLGTIDIAALARSVLLVGENENVPGERLMIQIKSSLTKKGMTQSFTLDPATGFTWTGESSATANDLLEPKKTADDDSTLGEARDFVLQALKDGAMSSKELQRNAKERGVAARTLERARGMLTSEKKIHTLKKYCGWVVELVEKPVSS